MNRAMRLSFVVALAFAPAAFGQSLALDPTTRVQGLALAMPSYDYVPSVVWTGKYRMWWCRGIAGDYIVYAESPTAAGRWTSPATALAPTGRKTDFDGQHVCDPSVVFVKDRWYLYYGAYPLDSGNQPKTTMIGVADGGSAGTRFTRAAGGKPIAKPYDLSKLSNPNRRYGAGQPSALYLDGWVYLIYTDSTGRDSNPINGGGVYVVRSKDPLFQGPVEELTRSGFAPRKNMAAVTTEYKLLEAFSVDWEFCDLTDGFLVAVDGLPGVTTIFSYDRSFRPRQRIDVPGIPWTEGPAFARRLDGHALPHALAPQSRTPLILFHSVGAADPWSWDLAFAGFDLLVR